MQLFEFAKNQTIALPGKYLDTLLTVSDYEVLLNFERGNPIQCKALDVTQYKLYCQPDKQAILENIKQPIDTQLSADIKVSDTQLSADIKVSDTQLLADIKVYDTQCPVDMKVYDTQCSVDIKVCDTQCPVDIKVSDT